MSFVLRAVRRMAGLPALRRLTRVEPLLRLSFALRAHLVSDPVRFARNELLGGRSAVYTVRGSPVAVAIRHRTPDVLVLDEVFSQREYEWPAPVEAALRRAVPLRVADLGANIGLFGAWLLARFPAARIVAFEADPANARLLAATVEANKRAESWQLVQALAATAPGTVRFAAGGFTTSRVDGHGDGIDVPAVDVFPFLQDVDFLKIDIEGGEWAILEDRRFAEVPARAVALEYHSHLCPQRDAASAA